MVGVKHTVSPKDRAHMSSSPIVSAPEQSASVSPARAADLLDLLARVPDPRKPRGVRHSMTGVLAGGIAAVASGARSFAAIGQWVGDLDPDTRRTLGMTSQDPPSETAIRRLVSRIDSALLDRVLVLAVAATRTTGKRPFYAAIAIAGVNVVMLLIG